MFNRIQSSLHYIHLDFLIILQMIEDDLQSKLVLLSWF